MYRCACCVAHCVCIAHTTIQIYYIILTKFNSIFQNIVSSTNTHKSIYPSTPILHLVCAIALSIFGDLFRKTSHTHTQANTHYSLSLTQPTVMQRRYIAIAFIYERSHFRYNYVCIYCA